MKSRKRIEVLQQFAAACFQSRSGSVFAWHRLHPRRKHGHHEGREIDELLWTHLVQLIFLQLLNVSLKADGSAWGKRRSCLPRPGAWVTHHCQSVHNDKGMIHGTSWNHSAAAVVGLRELAADWLGVTQNLAIPPANLWHTRIWVCKRQRELGKGWKRMKKRPNRRIRQMFWLHLAKHAQVILNLDSRDYNKLLELAHACTI